MKRLIGLFAFSTILAGAAAIPSANAVSCTGSCGTLGPDGVVSTSPAGGTYNYVTTTGGVGGGGQISGVGGTNGSSYTTNSFTANAGDTLEFFFNFVTSDGSGFADYAWAALTDTSSNIVAYLFTARTQPVGDTSPGFGLPANASTLTPATSGIIGGGPIWSALGSSSGDCFAAGCGYTGWIKSEYSILAGGTYQLMFGVTNWADQGWDSGLAFDGALIEGKPIDPSEVPLPAALPLLAAGLGGLGLMGRFRRKA